MNNEEQFQVFIERIKENIKSNQFKNKEELISFLESLKNNDFSKNAIVNEEDNLLALYDDVNNVEVSQTINPGTNYENILSSLEERIRNNEFTDKEALVLYIDNLKRNGMPSDILTNEKELELLSLYDELHPELESALDISNYKGVNLSEQNVIVSTENNQIIKTNENAEDLSKEFRENQNELTATSEDGLANADETFDYMKDYKKEELTLLPIAEAIEKDNISEEMLNKIKFFVTNKYTNPYSYHVDIENGVFHNVETDEVLEVRINEKTGQYEIYKGGELAYSENTQNNDNDEEFEKEKDTDEEEMAYENKNVKVKRLIKPLNNNAYVKSGLLFIICITISIILGTILLYIIK